MKMDEFTSLLSNLTQTCQELEEMKAEQTKDHEWVSKSYEKTLLSILQQEQSILNQVEAEHARLREQLSNIQKDNETAIQEGVSEINSMVHEISSISTHLKEALGTYNDSEPVMKEIKERLSKIFAKKKCFMINLRKVHFTPHPLMLTTLGEIHCEEQSLGFSVSCHKIKRETVHDSIEGKKVALLCDERPPWEDVSCHSHDAAHVGVKVMLNSDIESGSTSNLSYLVQEGSEAASNEKINISLTELAVKEADNAALSPRTATKIWISDLNQCPSQTPSGKEKEGTCTASSGESPKEPKPNLSSTKHITKCSPAVTKASCRVLQSNATYTRNSKPRVSREMQHNVHTSTSQQDHRSSSSRTEVSHSNKNEVRSKMVLIQADSLSSQRNATSITDLHTANETKEITTGDDSRLTKQTDSGSTLTENKATCDGEITVGHFEHDTLFRATAVYVCEDDSESFDSSVEEEGISSIKRDARACREVSIRNSRVPSARTTGDGDKMPRWASIEPSLQTSGNNENHTSRPNLHIQDSVDHTTNSKITPPLYYMTMSDSINSENLCPSPRSLSPAESVKSSNTFIIESLKTREGAVCANKACSVSRLVAKESRKGPLVITASSRASEIKVSLLAPKSKPLIQHQSGRNLSRDFPKHLATNIRRLPSQTITARKSVPRSTSMPYIERMSRQRNVISRNHRSASATERRYSTSSTSSSFSNPRRLVTSVQSEASQIHSKAFHNRRKPLSRSSRKLPSQIKLSKSESNLMDLSLDKDGGPNRLVLQFGKYGSGRAELNLPHGLYATTMGSLYVVDYGNKRLQVMDAKGKLLQQITLAAKNYFDVAVNNRGLVAITNSTDRTLEVYSKHGRLLQVISKNWGAPRGITVNYQDEFIVADMRLGIIYALTLDSTTGRLKESTIVPGFNKPYLVSSNSQGLLAISERGFDGGSCVKILREDWQLLRVLGTKNSPGPTLFNPWGVCIDSEGGVLVADWAHEHSIIYYPANKPAQILVRDGLSSPRGLALCNDNLLVADSMHNCIKVFQYQ